ncbi:MAG TPA: chorismate synthase [Myxococcaceae bacterium]|nr:chorismate synthase [Myxococcaceae bacterium]
MNTFGTLFRLTTAGESHGVGMTAIIDGCPAGVALDRERIQVALDRRRPGQSSLVTPRKEADQVEVLSGVFEGKTLGTPIATLVRNQDQRSGDYDLLKDKDRPGHADAVWRERYKHRDHRGGGRTSARETLCRVVGGAVAEAFLARDLPKVRTVGFVSQVADLTAQDPALGLTREAVDQHPTRCPDPDAAEKMSARILAAKEAHDSLGGAVDVRVEGLPVGLGEPVFGKIKAALASAIGGVNAVTGVVWGPPNLLEALKLPGSQFHTTASSYGGIQGGLSNGEPLQMRVFFKPPATLGAFAKGGRHDPCVLPRAVPVLEAMVSLTLADLWLQMRAYSHSA